MTQFEGLHSAFYVYLPKKLQAYIFVKQESVFVKEENAFLITLKYKTSGMRSLFLAVG
jgi:hypothetical protein